MAHNSDSATSNLLLLCSENSSTCFDDDGLECDAADGSNSRISHHEGGGGSELLLACFVAQSEEAVRAMVEREKEHLPRDDYLMRLRSGGLDLDLLGVRKEALDWIWKAHSYLGFGPLSFCLAVNYLDRFLSVFELPRGVSWTVQLLAVACLSIAAKMEEIKVPQSVDLQVGELKFLFEARTIQKMELLVLSTLRWKMCAITPCSFIDYFLGKITCEQIRKEVSIVKFLVYSQIIETATNTWTCVNAKNPFLQKNGSSNLANPSHRFNGELEKSHSMHVYFCAVLGGGDPNYGQCHCHTDQDMFTDGGSLFVIACRNLGLVKTA
eukprot:XP_014626722.1 cyclin-D4-1 [Glycine max]